MDLIKTFLLYMMMIIGGATENAPAITPPPQQTPAPTPYVTYAPTQAPTQAPTPTPVPYTTLYVGDRGEAVKKLQRRLTELGYLSDTIDGIYGQNTKRAVERFQYYNNLKVDGIAGKDTQTLLYESTSVVLAPPDITKAPTAAPTMPVSVVVPVYYVDEAGQLINRVNMTCYGTTTIYANSNNVGSGYTLASSGSVTVTIRNGVASPASVTFRYQKKQTPAPTASTVTIPVYYRTTDGRTLYQTTATLSKGRTSNIVVSTNLVPANYQLTSASVVPVTVSSQGIASPNAVMFTFRDASTPSPTQAPVYQTVTIYYLTEDGAELTRETRQVLRGQTATFYPNPTLVPQGYTLVSAASVKVSISQNGYQNPEMIYFRYAAPRPTQAPTKAPETTGYITVMLQDAQSGAILHSYQTRVTLNKTNTLYADLSALPAHYVAAGDAFLSVYVDQFGVPAYQPVFFVRNAATPAPTQAPTPAPTQAPTPAPTEAPPVIGYIMVMIQDTSGSILHTYQQEVLCGRDNTIYADLSGIPSHYAPAGETSLTFFVNESGIPAMQPIFYVQDTSTPVPTQQPTPAPTEAPIIGYIIVSIQDTNGVTLHSYQQEVLCGRNNTIYADFSGIPSHYVPAGETSMTIFVQETGGPDKKPIFYVQDTSTPVPTQQPTPAPTEAPASTQPAISYITVELQDTKGVTLHTYQQQVLCGQENTIYIDLSGLPSHYAPAGQSSISLFVTESGASETQPIFYVRNTATPPPPSKQPTPVPTAHPLPSGSLTEAGQTLVLNGEALPISWYIDENGLPMISLWALSDISGWHYQPNTGGLSLLAGCNVEVSFGDGTVYTLTVDGQSYADYALVHNDGLYVSAAFLEALNLSMEASGGQLIIANR